MNVIKHIQTQIQQPSVAIGTAALLILTSSMFAWRRRRSAAAAAAARSSKYPPETVVVYRYSHPEKKSNPDISPFIAKLEAYLKFSSTPHVLATGTLENAPKGKLPYIEHNGRLIGDSSLAIEYLVACGAAPDLDAGIGDEKKAVARAMKIMVEEHLYFALVWERWTVDENFKIYSDVVFGGLPFLQKLFVPSMVKKKLSKIIYAQGLGRHSPSEIVDIMRGHIDALATFLGDNQWLMGTEGPTLVDATLFGFLGSALAMKRSNPELNKAICSHANLVQYAVQAAEKYYPDYTFYKELL